MDAPDRVVVNSRTVTGVDVQLGQSDETPIPEQRRDNEVSGIRVDQRSFLDFGVHSQTLCELFMLPGRLHGIGGSGALSAHREAVDPTAGKPKNPFALVKPKTAAKANTDPDPVKNTSKTTAKDEKGKGGAKPTTTYTVPKSLPFDSSRAIKSYGSVVANERAHASVKVWFQTWLNACKDGGGPPKPLLALIGEAGCGKTFCLQWMCAAFGVNLVLFDPYELDGGQRTTATQRRWRQLNRTDDDRSANLSGENGDDDDDDDGKDGALHKKRGGTKRGGTKGKKGSSKPPAASGAEEEFLRQMCLAPKASISSAFGAAASSAATAPRLIVIKDIGALPTSFMGFVWRLARYASRTPGAAPMALELYSTDAYGKPKSYSSAAGGGGGGGGGASMPTTLGQFLKDRKALCQVVNLSLATARQAETFAHIHYSDLCKLHESGICCFRGLQDMYSAGADTSAAVKERYDILRRAAAECCGDLLQLQYAIEWNFLLPTNHSPEDGPAITTRVGAVEDRDRKRLDIRSDLHAGQRLMQMLCLRSLPKVADVQEVVDQLAVRSNRPAEGTTHFLLRWLEHALTTPAASGAINGGAGFAGGDTSVGLTEKYGEDQVIPLIWQGLQLVSKGSMSLPVTQEAVAALSARQARLQLAAAVRGARADATAAADLLLPGPTLMDIFCRMRQIAFETVEYRRYIVSNSYVRVAPSNSTATTGKGARKRRLAVLTTDASGNIEVNAAADQILKRRRQTEKPHTNEIKTTTVMEVARGSSNRGDVARGCATEEELRVMDALCGLHDTLSERDAVAAEYTFDDWDTVFTQQALDAARTVALPLLGRARDPDWPTIMKWIHPPKHHVRRPVADQLPPHPESGVTKTTE